MARPLIRIFVLFVLTVLLATPWSAAAPRQDNAPAPQLLARLWQQVAALWGDIGCIMDPGGACRESSAPTGDIGCGIDPHGGCGESSIPNGDIGCGADPNGGCGH
jgi:hypothetical protein